MIKKIVIAVLAFFIAAVGGFVAWGSNPLKPMPEAIAALQSDDVVQVTSGSWTVFQLESQQSDTGLIFYPGGRIDYRAYAPYLRALAEQGYLVVLVPMPLSLAVIAPERAADVIQAFPQVKTWAIGGHSLGGTMAATFAVRNPEQIQGLVLLAAYPAGSDSLVDQKIKVLSISATHDGLATREKIAASRSLLPGDAFFLAIQGGNHAQFGWYGLQDGDGAAEISREEQQAQVVQVIGEFMRSLSTETH